MIDFSDIQRIKEGYFTKHEELNNALKEYHNLGEAMAKAEKRYRVAKSQATLSRKLEGVQATLIPTIISGDVSQQRFDFKVSETMFHGCRENIKRLHSAIDMFRSLLSTAKSEINIR